jgi:hypothetical protein
MIPDQRIDRLLKLDTYYFRDAVPRLVKSIRTQGNRRGTESGYSLLADAHRVRAMQAKYIEGDDKNFRQHMYVACRLEIESIRLSDRERFRTGSELFDALMSDSPEVIDAMARFEPAYYIQGRYAPLNPEFLVHMWQLAILGDYETLQTKVDKLAKNGRKPWRKDCAYGQDFFSLLMRGDKAGLEARITHDIQLGNDDSITGDFFAYIATFEAKLCWHKGIEVQIDNPRVPIDLMPVRPLAHYDDVYDFLKPGWTPPKQGLVGRLSSWFRS